MAIFSANFNDQAGRLRARRMSSTSSANGLSFEFVKDALEDERIKDILFGFRSLQP